MPRITSLLAPVVLLAAACGAGTPSASAGEVVIYSTIDEEDLAPILARFEKATGIKARAVTDTEATKTAALVARIEAEKERPQADVYWGNEIFHTINLAEAGFFEPYRPKPAEDVPPRWRDKADRYVCLGVRARVIAVSTRPEFKDAVVGVRGLADLAAPALKGRLGVCHPGFGTASGHFAAMNVLWGDAKYAEFLKALHANEIKLLGGNAAVADQVAEGNLAAGPTDNDDVADGKDEKLAIDGVVPDQGDGESGTLLVPGTVSLLRGAPHPEAGKRLIDFICDPAIEKGLIDDRYFAWSVRGETPVRAMKVDYAECAHRMRHAVETALEILQDRK